MTERGTPPTAHRAPAGDLLDRLLALVTLLRRSGIDVSTGEVIDATQALTVLPLHDRSALRAALRAAIVKSPVGDDRFDRLFNRVFATVALPSGADEAMNGATGGPSTSAPASARDDTTPPGANLVRALVSGDEALLARLAEHAVELYAGIGTAEGSERYFLHRVMRAVDLSRMLAAALQQARRDGSADLELAVLRSELSTRIEEFRRLLAAEIAKRRAIVEANEHETGDVELTGLTDPTERSLIELSRLDAAELRRVVQPLARQLAARVGRRRRSRSTGRLDARRTVRRSLASGGVPLDIVHRRRYPHRPDVVLLCDVSGSVAEFAQFTFTLVNAIHAELARVRSFAFVDGIGEVTDLFAAATFEIPVGRFTERRGVLGPDGHSDYGRVFDRFATVHLGDAIGPRTTLIITGDARSNYRDPNLAALRAIRARARRVYWLHPEPEDRWTTTDCIIGDYRPLCDGVFPVATLGELAAVIADLV